ncbi:hypothetical protein [Carnobacterium maltaromaticum]|uniref:hypothetical protein n=1 Tax=Carnobacterium maltaromaticum TaxID=2751 RepID=UPI00295E396B|nr:hypothetical protein [Carnobacterium maltaromaticum]
MKTILSKYLTRQLNLLEYLDSKQPIQQSHILNDLNYYSKILNKDIYLINNYIKPFRIVLNASSWSTSNTM